MPDGSYSISDIQDYIKFVIKKHEILTIPSIHIYINRTDSRLVLKIKDEYKLELQTLETINLFGSINKLIDETKNGERVPSLDVVKVVM